MSTFSGTPSMGETDWTPVTADEETGDESLLAEMQMPTTQRTQGGTATDTVGALLAKSGAPEQLIADGQQQIAEITPTEPEEVGEGGARADERPIQEGAQESWSWGAAWSAFAGAVQQDVREISQSVKTAFKNVREEFQPAQSTREPSEAAQERSPSQSPSPSPEPLPVPPEASGEEVDKELDGGLEAIDQQVDQLAHAAGKAFGSFWQGLGGAMQAASAGVSSVAGQIEQAAMQATTSSSKRTPWQKPGRFMSSGGTLVLPTDGSQEDEWQVVDLLGSPATSVAASFEQLFKLYRGHRFIEDLEAIGNEAARSCNRVRTQLPDSHRAMLDSIVADIAAYVNLLATVAPSQDVHSATRGLIHDVPSSATLLEQASTSEGGSQLRGGPREGLASMCAASVHRAEAMRLAMSTESPQKAWEGLCRMRAEGLKLLAEFTALSLQHMAFLAMCLEGGDAEAAGLVFLPDGSDKGAVVRGVLLQLLSDTDAIFEAFYTALETATEDDGFAAMLLDPQAADEAASAAEELGVRASSLADVSGAASRDASLKPSLALVVGELKGGLLVGVKAAVERVMQGSRHLLYPICAPTAVQLDAEVGLSPVPSESRRKGSSGLLDEEGHGHGDVLAERQRTTSLSNPLFEAACAAPSHLPSPDVQVGRMGQSAGDDAHEGVGITQSLLPAENDSEHQQDKVSDRIEQQDQVVGTAGDNVEVITAEPQSSKDFMSPALASVTTPATAELDLAALSEGSPLAATSAPAPEDSFDGVPVQPPVLGASASVAEPDAPAEPGVTPVPVPDAVAEHDAAVRVDATGDTAAEEVVEVQDPSSDVPITAAADHKEAEVTAVVPTEALETVPADAEASAVVEASEPDVVDIAGTEDTETAAAAANKPPATEPVAKMDEEAAVPVEVDTSAATGKASEKSVEIAVAAEGSEDASAHEPAAALAESDGMGQVAAEDGEVVTPEVDEVSN